jgi:thiamine kinase-like enzyme
VIVGPDGRLTPIDFSLCGYSHYYMDLAGIYSLNYDDQRRNTILENYAKNRKCEIEARYLEPYFMLSIVLFIACQYERAKGWGWFPEKMEQWREEVFQPLADGVPFLKL